MCLFVSDSVILAAFELFSVYLYYDTRISPILDDKDRIDNAQGSFITIIVQLQTQDWQALTPGEALYTLAEPGEKYHGEFVVSNFAENI